MEGMTLPGFPPAGGGQRPPMGSPGTPPVEPGRDAPSSRRPQDRTDDARPREQGQQPPSEKTNGRGTRMIEATRTFTRTTAKRIDEISRKDGAEKTGLRTLIWSNCLSMGGDALVTVYLAATLFFAAPGEQQRSNVALYLLVTVAPFAVIAPVIGPLLDRIDRGRRAALAATAVLRAFLCYLLAVHTDSTVLLYICALLCLVLSRSYSVLKAAVVPRVRPEGMQLVTANSRMNVFGMVGAGVLGGIGAGLINVFNTLEPIEQSTTQGEVAAPTLGFTVELIVCALVFLVGAYVSLRLPAHVDTDEGEGKVSMASKSADGTGEKRSSSGVRLVLGTHVVTALRSSAVQKFLGGFLSFFLVFYIQATMTGFGALATLALLGAAAGAGSISGTAIGTRFADHSPDNLVLVASGVAVGCCVLAAITPGIPISIVVALIAAVASALGKIALDAIIQREIPEAFRSSAFSRSETVLQLSWVAGGTLGILLPTNPGQLWLGWTVATVILAVAFGLIIYGRYKAHQAGPRAAAIRPREPSERRFAISRNRRTGRAGRNSHADRSSRASGVGRADRNNRDVGHESVDDADPSRQHRPRQAENPATQHTTVMQQPDQAAGDEWLAAPAPHHQPTKALPDFRAAGLRPPPQQQPSRGSRSGDEPE